MECLLCTMWARMPYAKRHTTPTTAQETEGALIVGYWTASRHEGVPRICERHMAILEMLDTQEARRALAEQQVAQPPQQVIVVAPPIAQPPPPVTVSQGFKLGPGPLTNENYITQPPPLPVEADPSLPYRTAGVMLEPTALSTPVPEVIMPPQGSAKPGTMEGALEAARMPPVEGGKVTYPCPSCGAEVTTGDVHAC